jgi:hypothetical protein
MERMAFEGMKKLAKVIPLVTLAAIVQPQTSPDHPSTKPVGVREALRKMEGPNTQIALSDGRTAIIDDGSRKKEKPENLEA